MFNFNNGKINYIEKLTITDVKSFLAKENLVNDCDKDKFDFFEFDNKKNELKIVKSVYNDKNDKIVIRQGKNYIYLYTFGSYGLNEEQNINWLKFMTKRFDKDYYQNLIKYHNVNFNENNLQCKF